MFIVVFLGTFLFIMYMIATVNIMRQCYRVQAKALRHPKVLWAIVNPFRGSVLIRDALFDHEVRYRKAGHWTWTKRRRR